MFRDTVLKSTQKIPFENDDDQICRNPQQKYTFSQFGITQFRVNREKRDESTS